MNGYTTTPNNQNSTDLLPNNLITPSKNTNQLILLCLKVYKNLTDPRALGIVLDSYTKGILQSSYIFKKQTKAEGLDQLLSNSVDNVIQSFQSYMDALEYVRSWFISPQYYPLKAAPEKIHSAYYQLHHSLMNYEWDYLCCGDEPHPALNLLSKVIVAVKDKVMKDERFDSILNRLWSHFSKGLDTFAQDPDLEKSHLGQNAIAEILDGISEMDQYFEDHQLEAIDRGYIIFKQGCLHLIGLLQNSTGQALADYPTPSPQANWVIHAARAVLEGVDPQILIDAQAWFEPQLAESNFRFEQYANLALNKSAKLAEQVPIARDGFDRLNRSLPLLRLGIKKHPLLYRAIQYLEEGSDLLNQAWQVFLKFEENGNSVSCMHCGVQNSLYAKVCINCGAKLLIPVGSYDEEPPEEESIPSMEDDTDGSEDYLSRLMTACDAAKFGRISKNEFMDILIWGYQIYRESSSTAATLPQHSNDPRVAKAVESMNLGMESFHNSL
ncbi:zinc ribbon domain-containing protein, partial [bacterium]|nr:zinc ribbon domain-containing protein [bacterium]